MGIFKANDIRGIFPRELDRDKLFRIGFYLPSVLNARKILIGRDTRTSSDEILKILTTGILSAGADVCDIGICDTPAVYYATAKYEFQGSVMITASHNPPEYNGLKISGAAAVPVGPETGLDLLRRLIANEPEITEKPGHVTTLDIRADYVAHVSSFLDDVSSLNVIFDCGNGASSVYIRDIFEGGLADCSFLFCNPDGEFPNHGPNPLESESHTQIRQTLLDEKADLGVLFDGDADRAVFFDELGRFVSPDIITALIGRYYYDIRKTDKPMFYDIRSSKSVNEFITSLGGVAEPCVTGHANIKRILKSRDGAYAGELSGHYYFSDNFFCDSGFIAVAIVCSILKVSDMTFSEIVDDINPYFFSGEKNFDVKNVANVLSGIRQSYSSGEINEIDGIRIDFDSWWFNLRPSGAEPLLRLVVEAETAVEMEQKVEEISAGIATADC